MSRLSDHLTGWALAATGGVLALAAVATVLLLSSGSADGAHGAPAHRAATASPATGYGSGWGGSSTGLSASAHASASATVNAHHSAFGTILVNAEGDTLYAFSRDRRNHDACAAIKGCLATWPMLTVSGKPTAGPGVKASLLSTITVNGHRQVTYAGHPLYLFSEDDRPGDTGYVGESQSGGTWPAVAPSGKLVH